MAMKRPAGNRVFNAARVNVLDKTEEISWSFYDYLTYAAGGQSNLTFFQTAQGGVKTVVDTNMRMASQIPAGQRFMVTGISFEFQPGVSIDQADALNLYANDVNAVANSGYVELTIGSKKYVQNSPLGLFPPTYGLTGFAGSSTTVAATTVNVGYARISGQVYSIIPVLLESNQNFDVNVQWPALIALPSAVAGRLGCRLHGRLQRNAQ